MAACVRCETDGRRLVRAETVCASCHNGEREVEKGRDAKSKPPGKWATLLAPAVVVVANAGERRSIFVGLCTGRAEAERLTKRRWPGAVLVATIAPTKRPPT